MDLNSLQNITDRFTNSDKMPALFLGHGSPMNAIEENQFTQGFHNVSKEIPKPNAILCVSAHWFTDGTYVTSGENQRTIHDFYGFPPELFAVEYPAKGDPELAAVTSEILAPQIAVETDEWGLDHGAWSVLTHMYPEADIPVIQLSMDYTKPPQWHFDLAKKLKKLREKGVLIIGSGNIVHNLRMVDFSKINAIGYGYDWAIEARSKTNRWIMDGDFQKLINYQKEGTALQYAAPTPDHYLPMLYTLALKDENDETTLFNDQLLAGSLSMTSVKIG